VVVNMSIQHSLVVEEGARLRVGLPAYLTRRRTVFVESTLLIAPIGALVSGYEEFTTMGELWATGLDVLGTLLVGGHHAS
jgi:hypothetical protein